MEKDAPAYRTKLRRCIIGVLEVIVHKKNR